MLHISLAEKHNDTQITLGKQRQQRQPLVSHGTRTPVSWVKVPSLLALNIFWHEHVCLVAKNVFYQPVFLSTRLTLKSVTDKLICKYFDIVTY